MACRRRNIAGSWLDGLHLSTAHSRESGNPERPLQLLGPRFCGDERNKSVVLAAVAVHPECVQRPGAQALRIALAFLGRLDDPLGDHLFHERRRGAVSELSTRRVVGFAHRLRGFGVEHVLSQERNDGCHRTLRNARPGRRRSFWTPAAAAGSNDEELFNHSRREAAQRKFRTESYRSENAKGVLRTAMYGCAVISVPARGRPEGTLWYKLFRSQPQPRDSKCTPLISNARLCDGLAADRLLRDDDSVCRQHMRGGLVSPARVRRTRTCSRANEPRH